MEQDIIKGKLAKQDSLIKFKCASCHYILTAGITSMGEEKICPECGEITIIPHRIHSVNPFQRPLRSLAGRLVSIQWRLPFFPQLIETVVLLVVISIVGILYITIGVASQVRGIFESLMADARCEIKRGSLVEKSAYAVATGIYTLLWLPLWVVLLPFTLLGWTWRHLGYFGLFLAAVILAIIGIVLFKPQLLSTIGINLGVTEEADISQQIEDETNLPRTMILPDPWPSDFLIPDCIEISTDIPNDGGDQVLTGYIPLEEICPSIWNLGLYFANGIDGWSISENDSVHYSLSTYDFDIPLVKDNKCIVVHGWIETDSIITIEFHLMDYWD